MLDILGLFLNLTNTDKMCIRLFATPFWLLVLAFIVQFYSNYVYETFRQSTLLSTFGIQFSYYIDWVSFSLFGLSILVFVWQAFRLWKWTNCEMGNICYYCGGIVTEREGRFGSYFKCLSCGKNRSMRQ
jgi:hypothetical protein